MQIEMSEEIDAIAAALAKAQAKIEGAKKDADNPYFKSKYADLGNVWEACRKPLTDNGLAVVQMTEGADPELVTIVTMLTHESGQWMRGRLAMRPTKPDPQGVGSCITYGRRYGLQAMVGIAPEDDDGNAASKDSGPPPAVTDKQANEIADLIAALPQNEQQSFWDWIKTDSPENIPAKDYKRVKTALDKKLAKHQEAS